MIAEKITATILNYETEETVEVDAIATFNYLELDSGEFYDLCTLLVIASENPDEDPAETLVAQEAAEYFGGAAAEMMGLAGVTGPFSGCDWTLKKLPVVQTIAWIRKHAPDVWAAAEAEITGDAPVSPGASRLHTVIIDVPDNI